LANEEEISQELSFLKNREEFSQENWKRKN